jgi:hypothetical protein
MDGMLIRRRGFSRKAAREGRALNEVDELVQNSEFHLQLDADREGAVGHFDGAAVLELRDEECRVETDDDEGCCDEDPADLSALRALDGDDMFEVPECFEVVDTEDDVFTDTGDGDDEAFVDETDIEDAHAVLENADEKEELHGEWEDQCGDDDHPEDTTGDTIAGDEMEPGVENHDEGSGHDEIADGD